MDGRIWRSYVQPLTDLVYFTNQESRRAIPTIVQGFPSREREKIGIKQDFRPYLTADEAEWYTHLLSMLDFIQSLPFAQIAAATADARPYQLSGNRLLETFPEAMLVKAAYEDSRIASPKSHPGVCSIDSGQDMLVEHLAETVEGNGPRITSFCQCSSTVSSRWARIFLIPRCNVRICNG